MASDRGQPALLARLLLERGLLSPEDIVDRGIRVVSRSRSHALWLIRVDGGGGLAVKQAAPERGADPRRLDREAAVYTLAAARPALRGALPTAHEPGGDGGPLVLELIEPGMTLYEHCYHAGGCPPDLATALGAALGSAHRALVDCAPPSFTGRTPWVLELLEPGGADFAWRTPGTREALATLQESQRVRAGLRRARQRWLQRGVIHGDMKWDNCLIHASTGDAVAVKLIDWELADLGDRAWDVGGVLHEYAALETLTNAGSDRAAGPATAPLTQANASPAAFWDAYRVAAELAADEAAAIAERSALFAGARLVQTSLEHAAQLGAHAPTVGRLLEIALRVLENPAQLVPSSPQGNGA